MYLIVKYFEKNEIAVVPANWFKEIDSTAAWPPFKNERLTRAVKRSEEPQGWIWSDATILKTYESYDLARGELPKLAEARTDESEAEGPSSKRQRTIPARFMDTESFENEDDGSDDDDGQNSVTDIELPVFPANFLADLNQADDDADANHVQNQNLISSEAPLVFTLSPGNSGIDLKFQEFVISTLTKLTENVEQINRKVDKLMRTPSRLLDVNDADYNWIFQLPVRKTEDLVKLNDTVLADSRGKDYLVSSLYEVGGSSCKEAIRLMMKKLISYELASQFSWDGQKGKQKFSTFDFSNVILRALKLNSGIKAFATEQEVKTGIMNFLKHAPEKIKKSNTTGGRVNVNSTEETLEQGLNEEQD